MNEEAVSAIKLKYFDTVPPAISMSVLKSGFLFVACEFGNHYLYQIAHLGDDEEEPEYMPLQSQPAKRGRGRPKKSSNEKRAKV